ncbi:MAG: DMT family transporter [Gammaproteobacteria bacterium]|jgi:drug/metabolite transporter (DMT)-like permease
MSAAAMRSDLLPSFALAFGAAMWGLYWIPVRGIQAAGIDAMWTGPVIFGAATLLFVPLVLARFGSFVKHWHHTLVPGLLAGFAFALYIASLNLTDVVHAILLFYLSPLWSTMLGILVLNERLTINRVVGLLLAFCGLYVVLVVENGLPLPRNTGDWFALLSGICWSIASVKLFQGGARFMIEKVTMFVFFALLLSMLMLLWQQGNFDSVPGTGQLLDGWHWIALVALAMLPITYLTIWPTTLLSPARAGMLLMVEVIVGVASAALFSGDPFGMRELAGAVLIVSAAVVEVMRQQKIDDSGIVAEQADSRE